MEKAGVHTVVLCAKEVIRELEVTGANFGNVQVLKAPSIDADDAPPPEHWIAGWHAAAKRAAELSQAGHRVLVTCKAGLNRSGVVSALAIHYITGWSGDKCAKIVQGARSGSLFNQMFLEYLNGIPETTGPVQP